MTPRILNLQVRPLGATELCAPDVHYVPVSEDSVVAFDANTLVAVEISKAQYEALTRPRESPVHPGQAPAAGENPPPPHALLFSRRRPKFDLSADVSCRHLTLHLSDQCNQRCKYCWVANPAPAFGNRQSEIGNDPPVMTREIAEAALGMFPNDGRDLRIGFFGGEPLLHFGLMQRVVQMAEDRARLEKRAHLISRHDERDADHALRGAVPRQTSVLDHRQLRRDRQAARCRARSRQLCGDEARAAHAPRSWLLRADRPARHLGGHAGGGPRAARGTEQPVRGGTRRRRRARTGRRRRSTGTRSTRKSAARATGSARAPRSGGAPRWQYLEKTLQRILWQQFRPSECGAGRGYYTVGPSGLIYACHKQQNSEIGAVGQRVVIDEVRRAQWFDNRFCARSECAQCWARHVCGGACRSESLEFCGGIAQPHAGRCALMRKLVAEALVLSATLPRDVLLRICPAPERRNSAAISTAGKTLSAARGRPF